MNDTWYWKTTLENYVFKEKSQKLLPFQFQFQRIQAPLKPDIYICDVFVKSWEINLLRISFFCLLYFSLTGQDSIEMEFWITTTHYWAEENLHTILQFRYQHNCFLNVWAGVIGDSFIDPIYLLSRLNGITYLQFLRRELNDDLENVPLDTSNPCGLLTMVQSPLFKII